MVFCNTCYEVCQTQQQRERHIIHSHRRSIHPNTRADLENALQQRGAADDLGEPCISSGTINPLPAIPGLPVVSGFTCSYCDHAFKELASMRYHLWRDHQRRPGEDTHTAAALQRFHPAKNRSYHVVDYVFRSTLSISGTHSPLPDALHTINTDNRSYIWLTEEKKAISDLVRQQIKQLTHTSAGYDDVRLIRRYVTAYNLLKAPNKMGRTWNEIRELTASPDPDLPESRLRSCAETYLQTAQATIKTMPDYLLKKLYSYTRSVRGFFDLLYTTHVDCIHCTC